MAPLSDADQAAGYLLVELGEKGKGRIFWERDPEHPYNGEALVVEGKVVKVGGTIKVRQALAHNVLSDVSRKKRETERGPDLADLLDQGKIGDLSDVPAPKAELVVGGVAVDGSEDASGDEGQGEDSAEAPAAPKPAPRRR